MADINDFYGLGDLATFNQAVQQSDPYGLVARELNAWRPDTSTWSPMATGMTSFGKAFLSGMLGNYARQNAADQMNSVIGVLPQLKANPMAVTAPEGVDADAFSVLKGNAILRNYAAQAQEAEANKKFNLDILAKFLGKKVEVIGENEAYDQMGQGGMNPNSPAYKITKDQQSAADTLRKELISNKEISEFSDVRNRIQVLQKAAQDTRAASDLDYVYGIAKILDPSSVVRDSETGMVIESNSIPASTLGYLNKYVAGGAGLDIKQRQALFDLAKRHYDTRAERVGTIIDDYSTRAAQRGITENILPFSKDSLALAMPEAPIDTMSAIDRELARRGLGPDGLPLKAPLPSGPVRPY